MKIKLSICILLTSIASYSQEGKLKPLSVGSIVPNSIWNSIPKSKTGKLIILDFWATFCGSCYSNFPEIEDLQNKFKDKLQIVLVNSWENEKEIKERLVTINKRRDKNREIRIPHIPQINGDKLLTQLFPSEGPPQHIWINSERKVIAITFPYNATVRHVQAVLNGENISLSKKNDTIANYLVNSGLFKTYNNSFQPQYYSGFIKYNPDYGVASGNFTDSVEGTIRRSFLGWSVKELYRAAFFSSEEKHMRFINALKNKKKYEMPSNADVRDEWSNRYLFGYELQVPLKDEKSWKSIFQEDLNRYLGTLFNIEGKIEKRKFQSWVLIKTSDGLLKTTGDTEYFALTDTCIEWKNTPFEYIETELRNRIENIDAGFLFTNETGINNLNVDIRINGSLKDLQNVRKQLKQYGLDIIETDSEIEVLIISDKVIIEK